MFSITVAMHSTEYHTQKGCGKLRTLQSCATGDPYTAFHIQRTAKA